jgi:hypothetical protein
MLTPDAIADLAEMGFYFYAEPCPLRYILADIEVCVWATDDDEDHIREIIAQATRIATEGWIPVVVS